MSTVRVIYPLINVVTKVQSKYYTMTNYDVYKFNKVKYVRGNPIFFTDDLKDRNSCYKPLELKPITIEESADRDKWKYSYDPRAKAISNVDYIASVASYTMLTK